MRRLFRCSLISALTVVGSVIGAGFITGKEICEFFGKDFSLSGVYLAFICFSFTIYFLMSFKGGFLIDKIIGVFVSIANVVISACMISALEKVFFSLFGNLENIKIFTILSTILLFIISLNGVGAIEKFNSVFTPLIIVVVIILSLYKTQDYSSPVSPQSLLGTFNPIIYVGFNVVLSSGVIKNGGEKLSPPSKIISSIITSLILCALIYLISCATKSTKSSEMPFVNLFIENEKLLIIVDIITLFAIFTTLASSFYTSVDFGGIKIPFACKIVIFLSCLCIAKIGFSSIVEILYPLIGAFGYAVVLVTFLLSKLSLKEQRERTLSRQGHIG